ncbi:hypothetical protein ACFL1X_12800 [Candidatus Hydrogenedentota bacterium]
MKPDTQSILCDHDLLEVRDMHFDRLDRLFAGEELRRPFVLQGINGASDTDPYKEPEKWVDEVLDSLAGHASELKDEDVFRPLCVMFRPYCLYFIEPMFGARMYRHGTQWWAERLESRVGHLGPPDLKNDETWALAKRIVARFLKCEVTVPLFSMPTIQGALNTAVDLYGERFLLAMLEEPKAALHDLKIINNTLIEIGRWYIDNLPMRQLQGTLANVRCQPPGYGQIYGCSSHLVSAELYRDLVVPLDDELLSVYPNGGMIHLCADHVRHIPAWRETQSLRAIQVNDQPSDELEEYFKGLRDDQMIYVHPTQTMTVERAVNITSGKRTVIALQQERPCSFA